MSRAVMFKRFLLEAAFSSKIMAQNAPMITEVGNAIR